MPHRNAQGQLWSQGTPLTITLFALLVGGKFALGAWQNIHQQHPHGGLGEVLVMIALMLAMQSQIIWHRGPAVAAGLQNTGADE